MSIFLARVSAAISILCILTSCAGLGLPVPVGSDVPFEGKGSPKVTFSHPSDWAITEVQNAGVFASFFEFRFKTFPRWVVSRSQRSLWKASTCAMVIDKGPVSATPKFHPGGELLVHNTMLNLPKTAKDKVDKEDFRDVAYDGEDMPTVNARIEARYTVQATESTYRGSAFIGSKKVDIPWHSYAQSMDLPDTQVYFFCSGDTRYNNQFEALADSLGQTLAVN